MAGFFIPEKEEQEMRRNKVLFLVTWDVPTFDGSSGKLVYTEVVKARHPQIALWKACRGFIKKMRWTLDNEWKSIGGKETEARLLGGYMVGNPSLEVSRTMLWGQIESVRRLSQRREPFLSGLTLGPKVRYDPTLQQGLQQSACSHKEVFRSLETLSHSATLKVEVCKDCGVRRTRGCYQEGEPWL